ncbi:daf-12-interacting protein 1-like [Amphibalanus amphitrite]|uniref:daf-12-interacting protein 1-like n=1 Tax=Amphibalanus amphitrite TaxID=1232801 RepID=UPI001C9279C3|nr:daf-12-interacting protein 1-like [Amphibalanus amphitrite]
MTSNGDLRSGTPNGALKSPTEQTNTLGRRRNKSGPKRVTFKLESDSAPRDVASDGEADTADGMPSWWPRAPSPASTVGNSPLATSRPPPTVVVSPPTVTLTSADPGLSSPALTGGAPVAKGVFYPNGGTSPRVSSPPPEGNGHREIVSPPAPISVQSRPAPPMGSHDPRRVTSPPPIAGVYTRQPTPATVIHRGPAPPTTSYVSNLPTNQNQSSQETAMPDWWPKQQVSDSQQHVSDSRPAASPPFQLSTERSLAANLAGRVTTPQQNRLQPEPEYYDNTSPEWQARNATSPQSLSSHSPAPASSTTSGAVQIPSSAPKLPPPLPAKPGDRDPMTSLPQVPSRPGDRPAALYRSLANTEQQVARVVSQANQGFFQSARDVASIAPTLSLPPTDLDFTHPREEDFWNMSPRQAQMTSPGGGDVTRRLVTSEATQTEGDPLLESDDTWSRLLEAVASGIPDEEVDGSPGLRSRYGDTLRSQYTDTLRSQNTDTLRSQYRDTLRSQYRDTLRSQYTDTLRRRPDTDAAAQRPILPQGECQPHERLARQRQELERQRQELEYLEQQRRQQAEEEQQPRREHHAVEQERSVDSSQRQEQVFLGKRYNERRLYEEQQVVEQREHERRRYDQQEWLQKQEEERHWHEQERIRQQEDEERQKQEHQRLLQKQEDERRRQQIEREEEERRLQYQQYLQRQEEERRKREHEAYLKRQEEEIRRKQEEDELRKRTEREEEEQRMRKQKEEEEQRLLRQKEEEEKERLEQLRRQREQEEEQRQQELQEQLQRELRNQHQQQWRQTQQDQQARRERELRQQQQQLQQERQQAQQQQQQLAADWRRPAENTSPPVAGLRRDVSLRESSRSLRESSRSLRESSRAGDLARRAGRVWDEEADWLRREADWLRREAEETDKPGSPPVTQQRGDSYERTRVYSEMKTAAATSRGGAHGSGQRRASFQQSFMSPPPGGYLPPSSPSKSDPGWCRGEDNDSGREDNDSGRSSPNPLDDELEICLKSVEEAMASLQNSVQKSTARPETSSATQRPELNRSFEVSPAGGGSSGDWRRRSCDGAELETFGRSRSRSLDRAEERDRAEGAQGAQELRPYGVLRPLQHDARHLWTAAENTSSNWTRLVIGDWLLGAPDNRHPQEVLSRQIALWEGQPETPGPDWRQRGLRETLDRAQSGAQQRVHGLTQERALRGPQERALGGTQQRALGGTQQRALGGTQQRALKGLQERALGGSHYRGNRDPESEEHCQVDSQISRIGRESRQRHRHITDRMLPSPTSTYSGSSGQRSDSWRSSPQTPTPSPWQPSAASPPQSPVEGVGQARQSPSGSADWNTRHQPRQTSEQPAFPWQHNAPQEPPWAGHSRRANTLVDHRYGTGFGRRPTLTSYQSQSATLPAAQPRPAAPWDSSERENVHSPGSVRSSPGGPQVAAPSCHWAAPLSPSGSVSSMDWNQLFETSSEQSSCVEDEPSSVSGDWGRSLSREEVVRWYQQTQLPRGVGVDALTGRAAAWFHGLVGRAEAEHRLLACPPGAYLVRCSQRICGYTLSYRSQKRCKHFLVEAAEEGYRFYGNPERLFRTLDELLRHHTMQPITAQGGELLRFPCTNITSMGASPLVM